MNKKTVLIILLLCIFFNNLYPNKQTDEVVWGIDVSHHQKEIDWQLVKKQGVLFAYIKATEGGDFKDSLFQTNIILARKAGVAVGAYHFFTFCRSAKEQLHNFVSNVPIFEGDLPPAIDVEFVGNCDKSLSIDSLQCELNLFLKEVQRIYGVKPIIYTTEDFYKQYKLHWLEDYKFWIRSINKRPRLEAGKYLIWQYSIGAINGINKKVDINVLLMKLNELPRVQKMQSEK